MEETVSGPGRLRMKYNYMTVDHKIFRINEIHNYEKVIKVPRTEGCNCAGNTNFFYIVNGSRIPVTRADMIGS